MSAFEDLVRGEAPLLDAYLTALDGDATPFTIPGHKRSAAFGRVVAGDVPLHGGLDSIWLTGGLLAEAERRAAALWGADVARFSVAGSTHGNQALALAVGRPGDRVVVPRTLHRSLLLGLVLAGLEPVWLPTRVDPGYRPAARLPPRPTSSGACATIPTSSRSSSATRPTSARSASSPRSRTWCTRPGCRCWSTRPGARTSASTRRCPRTRCRPGPTRW